MSDFSQLFWGLFWGKTFAGIVSCGFVSCFSSVEIGDIRFLVCVSCVFFYEFASISVAKANFLKWFQFCLEIICLNELWNSYWSRIMLFLKFIFAFLNTLGSAFMKMNQLQLFIGKFCSFTGFAGAFFFFIYQRMKFSFTVTAFSFDSVCRFIAQTHLKNLEKIHDATIKKWIHSEWSERHKKNEQLAGWILLQFQQGSKESGESVKNHNIVLMITRYIKCTLKFSIATGIRGETEEIMMFEKIAASIWNCWSKRRIAFPFLRRLVSV